MKNDFSKLTIEEFEPEGSNSKGWTGDNGLTISAPAQNRTEALQVSNELMKKILNGYVLK